MFGQAVGDVALEAVGGVAEGEHYAEGDDDAVELFVVVAALDYGLEQDLLQHFVARVEQAADEEAGD